MAADSEFSSSPEFAAALDQPPATNRNTDFRRQFLRVTGAVCWFSTILLLTHLPPDSTLMRQLPHYAYGDKLVHGGLYAVLGLLLWYGRQAHGGELILGLLLAAGDELSQPWFGRTADLGDWLVDALGLVAGLGLASVCRRYR